jgi:hypothetical protein
VIAVIVLVVFRRRVAVVTMVTIGGLPITPGR